MMPDDLIDALYCGYKLSMELMKGCMCGSCYEYVLSNDEEEFRAESLSEVLHMWKNG